MYTVLLLLGFGLTVYGIILEKGEKKFLNILSDETTSREFQDIEAEGGQDSDSEWNILQKPLFSQVLEQEMDQEKARFLLDEREQAKERKRIIEGLDQGTYSVDLVCSLLNMEKGEVLLLKNISDKFGK